MHWLLAIRFWLLLGATCIAGGLAYHSWRRRTVSGAVPFAAIMLAVAVWSGAVIGKLMSTSHGAQQFWINLGFVGVVAVSPAWLVFTLQYTGRSSWLSRSTVILLSVIPVITLGLLFLPETRGLVLQRTWGNGLAHESYGNWFWVLAGFAYLCNLVSLVLMLLKLVHSPPLYRQQTLVILFGGLAPWIANLLHLAGVFPATAPDPTPLCFALSGLVLAWGLFSFGLLEIMPVARDEVIEHLSDAMLVFDAQGRIVDLNPTAERLFNTTARRAIGSTAADILGDWADLNRLVRETTAVQTEAVLDREGASREHDVRITPLFDRRNQVMGRLVVLRDITESKQGQRERERLIHDLKEALDNLKILGGLLPICASCKRIRDDRGYWNQLESYIQAHSGATFSHGLCPDCVKKLYPEIAAAGVRFPPSESRPDQADRPR